MNVLNNQFKNLPIKIIKFFFLILFGFLSIISCKKDIKSSTFDYPLSKLDSIIQKNIQPVIDTSFLPKDKGMLALSVYLMENSDILVDKTYYLSNNGNILPNDSTLFQLGSVTKVFTAAMIAQQVNKEALDLYTPVKNYLPQGRPTLPNTFNKKLVNINLNNLMTMSSGLPRDAKIDRNTDTTSYEFAFADLDTMKLEFASGSDCYLYSNLGFGIAGLVLSNQANPDGEYYYNQYETVLIDSLLNPMGMINSRITLDSTQIKQRALPYGNNKLISQYWNPSWPMNNAAGGLYSTISDMQIFAKNMIGEGSVLNDDDLDTLLTPKAFVWKDTCKIINNSYSSRQAMGWRIYENFIVKGDTISRAAKNGGLSGTSTYVTFSTALTVTDKKYKGFVVLLVNRQGFNVQLLGTNTLQQLFELIPDMD